MSLIRWQPFTEINNLQREMNSLFDSIVPTDTDIKSSGFIPAAEMSETNEAVHLKLEVPGLDAKDIDIQVAAESIAISGERRTETKTETDGMTRSEFRYGSFRRVLPLPSRVKNTEVKAEYQDGILNLTLPKAEAEKNKVVKVQLD
ncbi:MAG: Hsp20/alpha crystallin family protein [Cyanobacteria bacterium P01_E01_bin.35]